MSLPRGLHYMTQGKGFCYCSLFISHFAKGDYYSFGPEGKNNFPLIYFKWHSSYGEIIMLIIPESVLWKGGEKKPPQRSGPISVKAGYAQAVTAINTNPFPVQKRSSQGSRENPPAMATAQGHLPAPLPALQPGTGERRAAAPGAAWAASRAGCTVQPSAGLRSQKHTGNTVST